MLTVRLIMTYKLQNFYPDYCVYVTKLLPTKFILDASIYLHCMVCNHVVDIYRLHSCSRGFTGSKITRQNPENSTSQQRSIFRSYSMMFLK